MFTGKQGGPVADLAALVGEVVKVERAPIVFAVHEGKAPADRRHDRSHDGAVSRAGRQPTTLLDSIYSTIPRFTRLSRKGLNLPDEEPVGGCDADLRDHNAIQGLFAFEA